MKDALSPWMMPGLFFVLAVTALLFLALFIWRLRRRRRFDVAKITLADIDRMTGYEFEEYLYVLLTALDYETFLTKKSRDFGADLLFYDTYDQKTVVQAKRLADPLGLTAVQEVYAAKAYYEADKALIITTAPSLTESCRKLASAAKVTIVDREQLVDIVKDFKRGREELARVQLEAPYEQVAYREEDSLEQLGSGKGLIQAGEFYYRGGVSKG
ncbi:restriction endonuclease [Alkalihalobacillus oceani]|uniref:restriction endonuclease n=1 Tax=Halalkalibacter oceani TaxID=1653776 RepID=UPI00203C3D2B|nr:restriction endonuclease [Halalkalibacter oceani]MCM3759547.1 restriction endonuclease [Halalkalibacter oceani]